MHNADQQSWERARLARDSRFDGRLFFGVLSTGVYCRPICPAPTALAHNVRYFPSAAAAVDAGFRPCKRCRPETAPGSSAWLGASALVRRALELLSQNLDSLDNTALATQLSVSERQLHRVFVSELGAPPGAIRRQQRLQFARQLLDDSDLNMTQIAMASGFGSLRSFNTAIRNSWQKTPSELRQRRSKTTATGLQLRLRYRPPLDWESLLGFYRLRHLAGFDAVDKNAYRRAFSLPDASSGWYALRPADDGDALLLDLHLPDAAPAFGIMQRVRRQFDLDADPIAISTDLRQHSDWLAPALARWPGLRLPGAWDGFELAVRAVLGQQISVAAARTLGNRIVARHGVSAERDGWQYQLFPDAVTLANGDLDGLGITGARVRCLRALATAVADGSLQLTPDQDSQALRQQLLALPGIGPWTADYIRLRALHDPDAMPAADLGLRQGAGKLRGGAPPSTAELNREAEAWQPWRGYAAQYLWQSCSLPETKP